MARDAFVLSDIDAFYGDSHVLHGVSLRLVEGRLLGLLGRNGAGKSTCMNVAVGLVIPRRGDVLVFGERVTGHLPEQIAATGVALVPQGRRIFKSLTVRENLMVAARPPRTPTPDAWSFERVAATFPRLGERHRQVAGYLSGGEQQMLAIGRCLMGAPELIMFDEPSLGLAPAIVHGVLDVIRDLNRDGITCLLVEQNVVLSLQLASRAYVLENGRVTLTGSGAELLADDRVRSAYLGL